LGNVCLAELEENNGLIPGLVNFDGHLPTKIEDVVAIQNMFSHGRHPPRTIYKDPLSRFLCFIGPRNAALLQNIKFEGAFKAGGYRTGYSPCRPVGLADSLAISSALLSEICPHLKQVTIFRTKEKIRWATAGFCYLDKPLSWDDPEGEKAFDDELVNKVPRNICSAPALIARAPTWRFCCTML
jgi:hypothetical protein